MKVTMIATRRNFTPQQKAAYRDRVQRRGEERARLRLRSGLFMSPRMAEAFDRLRESAEATGQVMANIGAEVSRQLGGWQVDRAYVDEIVFPAQTPGPKLEELLGIEPSDGSAERFVHTRGPLEGELIPNKNFAQPHVHYVPEEPQQ